MAKEAARLFGKKILEEFKQCGITHIVWLPCFQLGFIYEAMMNQHEIKLVPVCREGEGIAVAAGLTLGGKKPVVLYQNSYRGWQGTDSAGVIMEPTLDAWQVKYHILKIGEDVGKIALADKEAQATRKPVAILMVGEEP